MDTLEDVLIGIRQAIGRKNALFGLTETPGSDSATLAVGAPTAVNVKGGFILALGLTRDKVASLRDQCNAFLNT